MDLASREWLSACILDVCVKVVYTCWAFFLLTFLAESVGFAISVLHFFRLFLAFSAAASFELVRIELAPALRFPFILILTNVLFVAGLKTLFMMPIRLGEVGRTAVGGVGISPFLMTTNLVTLTLMAGIGCMVSHARQSL
jgi:hypothetical protein